MAIAVCSYFDSTIVARKMSKDPWLDSVDPIISIVVTSASLTSINCIDPRSASSTRSAY